MATYREDSSLPSGLSSDWLESRGSRHPSSRGSSMVVDSTTSGRSMDGEFGSSSSQDSFASKSARVRRGSHALRRKIISGFKRRGLQPDVGALNLLLDKFATVAPSEVKSQIQAVLSGLENESLTSCVLTQPVIASVLNRMQNTAVDESLPPLRVVPTFEYPRLRYNTERRALQLAPLPHAGLAGPVKSIPLRTHAGLKAQMFRDRYLLLRQRVLRNKLFTPPILKRSIDPSAVSHFELTPIDSLSSASTHCCVLGLLVKLPTGEFGLEDLDGTVPISLANTQQTSGLFTENCFVLAEGSMVDSVFVVDTLAMPPPESAAMSLASLGSAVDPFGGALSLKDKDALTAALHDTDPAALVVLSDVWLDVPEVFGRLHNMFKGMEPMRPAGIVLMGNFTSAPLQSLGSFREPKPGQPKMTPLDCLRDAFDELADIIHQFPDLVASTHFIFVPGPNDPGLGRVLPRPPLSPSLRGKLGRMDNVHFTTNPTRLRLYTQTITLFREDLATKLMRHCVLKPDLASVPQIHEHLVKTIVDQAHLLPLPLSSAPVYWPVAHALNNYPLPDVLLLADPYTRYVLSYEGTVTCNPSSFGGSFDFLVYTPTPDPSPEDIQFSRVWASSVPEPIYAPVVDNPAAAAAAAAKAPNPTQLEAVDPAAAFDDPITYSPSPDPSPEDKRAAQIARAAQAREMSPAVEDPQSPDPLLSSSPPLIPSRSHPRPPTAPSHTLDLEQSLSPASEASMSMSDSDDDNNDDNRPSKMRQPSAQASQQVVLELEPEEDSSLEMFTPMILESQR